MDVETLRMAQEPAEPELTENLSPEEPCEPKTETIQELNRRRATLSSTSSLLTLSVVVSLFFVCFLDFLCALELSGTESQIVRFTELRAWNRQKFRSEERNNECRIAENRFRIAIRIAAYQCLKLRVAKTVFLSNGGFVWGTPAILVIFIGFGLWGVQPLVFVGRMQIVIFAIFRQNHLFPVGDKNSRKGFCRNPMGIFPNKVLGEFCGGFFGGIFFGIFPWKKIGGKNPRQKIHGKIQIGIWEFRSQNPHWSNLALTKTPFSKNTVFTTLKSDLGIARFWIARFSIQSTC